MKNRDLKIEFRDVDGARVVYAEGVIAWLYHNNQAKLAKKFTKKLEVFEDSYEDLDFAMTWKK